jgi:hypothetical protein
MNLEELGGFDQGPTGEDVIQRLPEGGFPDPNFPYGGVWSRPAIWPGEGGWVYIPTATEGPAVNGSSTQGRLLVFRYSSAGGEARLVPVSSSADSAEASFGFGSSAPVITSNGVESGSALVWTVWEPVASHGNGHGAQLRAYEAIPGEEGPRLAWSEAVGDWTKFEPPGVAEGRMFVGTYEEVIAFGPPLTTTAFNAPMTIVGGSTKAMLTLTATRQVTVSALETSSPRFALGAASRSTPVALDTGEALEVPVTFQPTAAGTSTAYAFVTVNTGEGSRTLQFPLQGTATTPSSSSPPGEGPGTRGTSPGSGSAFDQAGGASTSSTVPKMLNAHRPVPRARLVAARLVARSDGELVLHLRCLAETSACVGDVTLSRRTSEPSRRHAKRHFVELTLARGSFRVAPDHDAAVELRLSARALALLRRSRTIGAVATMKLRGRPGAVRQSQLRVRIRLPAAPGRTPSMLPRDAFASRVRWWRQDA